MLAILTLLAASCFILAPSGAGTAPPPSGSAPPPATSSAPPPAATTEAPAPSTYSSLQLHNDCPETVKLFFGEKPKFGSGTYTSLSSNTTTSYTGNAGDMIWIVDDSQNGVSSTMMSAGSQSLKITESCSGFAPY